MAINYLDRDSLSHLLLKLKTTIPDWIKDTFALKTELPTDAEIDAWNNKVDKVDGKGLSTNDLTNALKTNYDAAYTHSQSAHAPTNAERNVIASIKKNGTALAPDGSRAVDITVPSTVAELSDASEYAKASDIPTNNNELTNGAGYQTATQVNTIVTGKGYQTASQVETAITSKGYQTAADVNAAIADASNFKRYICQEGEYDPTTGVPTVTGDEKYIYLVPKSDGASVNTYSEWIYIASSNTFEKIGDTAVDLDGYVKTTDLVPLTNEQIDTIVAST